MNPQDRPRLAVTLGDPAGIGPEVVLKSLADSEIVKDCEITVIGNESVLSATYDRLQNQISASALADPAELSILDIPLEKSILSQIQMGVGNAASGAASFAYLETAIARTLSGEFDGIVTGPIAKSAWKAAGREYPGQTELLAERSGIERFGMLFVARSPYTDWTLRTLLATTHIPLRQVAEVLTPELMSRKLDLLIECLRQDFGLETPTIAIAGLNPHSGEGGQLGREEQDRLIPWLETERRQRPELKLVGPIPPDTMWVNPGQAWFGRERERGREGEKEIAGNVADAYLALYHDQGLIPVKLMAFEQAINTSIGLPFIRTSPDHGTAFDIAGSGIANANSMKASIALAARIAWQRGQGESKSSLVRERDSC
jgi:4-hydroxythreonine-4-phosphate dehydrogenase